MTETLNSIMLIDDNKIDNMFHGRVIKKSSANTHVIAIESGEEALNYLKNCPNNQLPDVIFLDINMPGMNGWEFIEQYKKLDPDKNKSLVVVMLSAYELNNESLKRKTVGVFADFKTKPLNQQMLDDVTKHFKTGKP
ncbi:MAG: response regulator [Bacteroidota bacterium]